MKRNGLGNLRTTSYHYSTTQNKNFVNFGCEDVKIVGSKQKWVTGFSSLDVSLSFISAAWRRFDAGGICDLPSFSSWWLQVILQKSWSKTPASATLPPPSSLLSFIYQIIYPYFSCKYSLKGRFKIPPNLWNKFTPSTPQSLFSGFLTQLLAVSCNGTLGIFWDDSLRRMPSWQVKVKAEIIYYKWDNSKCQCYSNGDHSNVSWIVQKKIGHSFQLSFARVGSQVLPG